MFNMFHSECFSCHKRAAAAIDRRINYGRLVERPPLFVAVLRCVFNAARELVQFHKELSTKKKRQEQELEELVALQEALMRERGVEGIVNDAKDSRGEEKFYPLWIKAPKEQTSGQPRHAGEGKKI